MIFINFSAEASRQMHRAVLDQIVLFLQRTHRSLDCLNNSKSEEETFPRYKRGKHKSYSLKIDC